jgi:hypothetical protein
MLFAVLCWASLGQEPAQTPGKASDKPAAQQAPAGERTFTSPKGKRYSIHVEPEEADSDAAEAETLRALPEAERAVIAGLGPDDYHGVDRKAAKLSIADAETEGFSDLNDLLSSLPAKSVMTDHDPEIKTTATSNRVDEEKRNVRVSCFLYAATQENDRDYHLILGRPPGATPEKYMTMELSGLPPKGFPAFAKLSAARRAFKQFFSDGQLPHPRGYDFYNPPIPVVIEGSLFFDMTHAHGEGPGPKSLRPKMPVIWEVHPITKIEFEP